MISILVVNHNGADVLPETLRRLAEQQRDFHEIVLADNASTDGSADAAQSLAEELGLTLRRLDLGENLGFGAANNRAAEAARGDQLLLLNSDAWPEPGSLPALAAALDEDPGLGLATPVLRYPAGGPQFHWAPTTGVVGEALQLLRNRFESNHWAHALEFPGRGWYTAACVLVCRAAFEDVGGFDEGYFLYFEDVDFCLRLRRAGWRLRTVPGTVAFHAKGGSQDTERDRARDDRVASLEYRRGQLRYYRKWRPAWENAVLRRRLRRKFETIVDEDERRRYLELLG